LTGEDSVDRAWKAHAEAVAAVRRYHDDVWSRSGLTMPQMRALAFLYRKGDAKAGDLAAALGVSAPTVTGIVGRLVARGLVQRKVDPSDKRKVVCALTPKGAEIVRSVHHVGEERMKRFYRMMDPEDRLALERGLRALIGAIQQSEAGGGDDDEGGKGGS